MVARLSRCVHEWLIGGTGFPGIASFNDKLGAGRLSYDGEIVSVRRELTHAKVIPCWPKKGTVAVVDVVDLLDGEARSRMLHPQLCLKARELWPQRPRTSRVHASDD
eukprot:5421004-Amphidinium_carterae.2